jgi:hypothetical protein
MPTRPDQYDAPWKESIVLKRQLTKRFDRLINEPRTHPLAATESQLEQWADRILRCRHAGARH